MNKIKNYFEQMTEDLGFAAYVFKHLSAMEDSAFYMVAFETQEKEMFLLGSQERLERDYLFHMLEEEEIGKGNIDWGKVVCTRIEPNNYISNSKNILQFAFNIIECENREIFYNVDFKTGINDLYSNFMDEYMMW